MPKRSTIGLGFLAVVAVAGFAYYLVFIDDTSLCEADPQVCPCLRIIPENKNFGITYETDDNGRVSKVNFGGEKARDGDPSGALVETYVSCLKELRQDIELVNYTRIDTSPVGQVANQWTRQPGIRLNLRPADAEEAQVLNNLQIGPISGLKWQVVEQWCSQGMMGRCVSCSPSAPDRETVAVEVRLRSAAPLRRDFWSDGWPKNVAVQDPEDPARMKPLNQYKDWELVDETGKRYLYACAAPG